MLAPTESLENYEMISNEFNFAEIRQSESFAIKKYRDYMYKGQVVNKHWSGFGVAVYDNGRVFEGHWQND